MPFRISNHLTKAELKTAFPKPVDNDYLTTPYFTTKNHILAQKKQKTKYKKNQKLKI